MKFVKEQVISPEVKREKSFSFTLKKSDRHLVNQKQHGSNWHHKPPESRNEAYVTLLLWYDCKPNIQKKIVRGNKKGKREGKQ